MDALASIFFIRIIMLNLRNAKNIDKLLIKMIEPERGFENTENMLCRE